MFGLLALDGHSHDCWEGMREVWLYSKVYVFSSNRIGGGEVTWSIWEENRSFRRENKKEKGI